MAGIERNYASGERREIGILALHDNPCGFIPHVVLREVAGRGLKQNDECVYVLKKILKSIRKPVKLYRFCK